MSCRLVAIASLAVAIFGCGSEPASVAPPSESEAATRQPPKTVVIASGTDFVVARYPATALARADGAATLPSPCEGRLLRLLVNEGDTVTAGTPLGAVACLDAGVLASRRSALDKRIAALGKRRRELDDLRRDGLVEIQRIVDADRELLALRGELDETDALIARSGLTRAPAVSAAGSGELELVAPRDGIVTHIAVQPGALLDRIGTPILTLADATTDRIEATLPVPPTSTATFAFVPLSGKAVPVGIVSIRGPDGDAPTMDSALRAVFAIASNDGGTGQIALMPGSRGHLEVREASSRFGLVPSDALQRRPSPRGSADIFCIFPADTAMVCHPVSIVGARGDAVLVTDAPDGVTRIAPGLVVLSEVPSHIAAEREETP